LRSSASVLSAFVFGLEAAVAAAARRRRSRQVRVL
jgi:hypothetical protein